MKKITILFTLFAALFIVACTPVEQSGTVSFENGIERIHEIDESYDSGMVSVPITIEDINGAHAEFLGFAAANDLDPELELLVNFRIKVLEAKQLFEEGWKHGKSGTTEFGIACTAMFDKVKESSDLRNRSAVVGFDAVDLLEEFIDTYPEQAQSLNLSQRDALILKTIYFEIQEVAVKDDRTITKLCADKVNKEE